MVEKYSNGAYSEVYTLSDKEKCLFPKADLVRIDETRDKYWFARLFYKHKIAHLLFPDNFIDVVGAKVTPHDSDLFEQYEALGTTVVDSVQRTIKLYSKLAEVDPKHADFSSHIKVIRTEYGFMKASLCECHNCITHRKMHEELRMQDKATNLARDLSEIGFGLPCDDSSDYCLLSENVIFFEIDDFKNKTLYTYLNSLENPTSAQKASIKLLNRYAELKQISKDLMLTGKCREFKSN